MSIKAVAFDIDGTLYPNRSMYFHSTRFFLTHRKLIKAFSQIRHDIREVETIKDFDSLQSSLLAQKLSISQESAHLIVEEILYGKWEYIFRRVKPFKGVKEVLLSLKKRGLKLGALSDFPVGNKLDYFGLGDCWDVTMGSHESGYLKPSKEPFLELAKRLGVEPSEILYVGNNYPYDVLGSNDVGMISAYIAPSWKKSGGDENYRFSNYKQFAQIMDDLLSVDSDSSEMNLSC